MLGWQLAEALGEEGGCRNHRGAKGKRVRKGRGLQEPQRIKGKEGKKGRKEI